jgi:intein/homing endonuclease
LIDGVVAVIVDECFAPDTQVLTPKGYVNIQDIKAGDVVINYCEETKEFKEDIVVKLHTNLTSSASEEMYELTLEDGSIIEVTGNHKFLTTDGWKRVDELTEFDDIIDYGE